MQYFDNYYRMCGFKRSSYVLVVRLNDFFNFEVEEDSKVFIDCYNKKNNLSSSIILLMEDICGLAQDLNISNRCHIYRKANRTTNYLAKKYICNTNSVILWSEFPINVINFVFEDYCENFLIVLLSQKRKKATMIKRIRKLFVKLTFCKSSFENVIF